MDANTRIEQLERKLQYLMDRTEILDCIARHARGCDRHDSDLLASAYHADGVDEHGWAINSGPKYPEWANAQHSAGSQQNMHNITTHACEIDGDVAHAESYAVGLFLNPDGQTARLIAGRYADRLERRDGEWRIALRRTTVDVLMTGEATILSTQLFKDLGYVKGMRDKRDVAYQRPLTLDETPADRW
ncbi:nuclear transport factor 2 family protein [Phenylobacterium sp. LjRoot225]|uniref:nuclear transport factor 2 family protein n=1 Tax=Phenylobacterium sp. LjRoot225 TaxID=3342285 RepID=UPI003ECF6402